MFDMDYYKVPHELDGDTPIWRYMSLSKFTLLLCRRKLWFSRADLLGDIHEGAYPEQLISEREGRIGDKTVLDIIERGSKFDPKCNFISCWTKNKPESFAMWNIYTPKSGGVAIESSVENLANSLILDGPKKIIDYHYPKIVSIKYDLDNNDIVHDPETYNRYEHKLMGYEYEDEIRFFIHHFDSSPPRVGWEFSIDPDKLIERIYLSHRNDDEIEHVKDLLKEANLVKEIVRPSFVRKPRF
jgi:hypothetical protein